MQKEKYLIVLGGATASGKTKVGIDLAQQLSAEIISADSRQFYREMNIGTAKPSPEELDQIPHHLINSLSIKDAYSVGDFEKEGLQKLNDIFSRKDYALLVGGSGLYIKALCEGLDPFPKVSDSIRHQLELDFEEKGLLFLQNELKRVDPVYYQRVDLDNPHRLIRALAVYRASGQSFSTFLVKKSTKRPFQIIYLCLYQNRTFLYDRINTRVDQMMEAGQLEEAKDLFAQQHLQSLQTVGYQELFNFLKGEGTLETAIELIKRNSRRYAKRQGTWFRKAPHWFFFQPNQLSLVLSYLKLAMEQNISFRRLPAAEFSDAHDFYSSIDLTIKIQETDKLIACFDGSIIIATVKLEIQRKKVLISDFKCLEEYTGRGIEEMMLAQILPYLDDKAATAWIDQNIVPYFMPYHFKTANSKEQALFPQGNSSAESELILLIRRKKNQSSGR